MKNLSAIYIYILIQLKLNSKKMDKLFGIFINRNNEQKNGHPQEEDILILN